MRVLHLPLKKVWFDMIKSGVKKEEYREIKDFYIKRFCSGCYRVSCVDCYDCKIKKYDKVVFTLGYPNGDDSERRLEFNNPSIRVGEGKPEWGAEPGEIYYVITWDQ